MSDNKIPVMGIPTLNRGDLLRRCLDSIDYPIENLVLVNNGHDPVCKEVIRDAEISCANGDAMWERCQVVQYPVNAGVAASWNTIITLFPAPWWMLVNDDIMFTPGDLAKMTVDAWRNGHKAGCIFGNHGASWYVRTKYGVDMCSTWDCNITPAYLEDCDMSYRNELLGVLEYDVEDVHAIHGIAGNGSQTINLTPELAAKNSRTHAGNFEYYIRKWGGVNGEEKFKTPFNDPNWPVWAWKLDVERIAKQQW
jgi:glycosyltransferase involved in cell wall biosynthesis